MEVYGRNRSLSINPNHHTDGKSSRFGEARLTLSASISLSRVSLTPPRSAHDHWASANHTTPILDREAEKIASQPYQFTFGIRIVDLSITPDKMQHSAVTTEKLYGHMLPVSCITAIINNLEITEADLRISVGVPRGP